MRRAFCRSAQDAEATSRTAGDGDGDGAGRVGTRAGDDVRAAGGITRNPWDPQRTPGGSSGGSGAAVAAALVPGATASDGAGSIRIPAACCGLFGLKVSRGGMPTAPYEEFFSGLSEFGFLTRTVDDAALLYEVVTGKPYVAAAQVDPPRLRIALALRIPPGNRRM